MSAIQIFGFKKCKDSRKAQRFFSERSIKVQFIDLAEKSFSEGELRSIVNYCCNGDAEELLDKKSKAWEKSNLGYMRYDPFEIIIEKPELVKTPIVRRGGKSFIGADMDNLKNLLEE